MIFMVALSLVVHPAQKLVAMPFAKGPEAFVSDLKAAISKCHAPAEVVQSDDTATVFLPDSRSDRAFNCLSTWIANHPETGFVKFGFVGLERQ